jgi:hypothetical protein
MPFLNPDHRPSIKHPQGHPVDVILTINPDGKIRIDYFRIEDDRQERFSFKLQASHLRKAFNHVETYDCEYLAYGRKNSIVLLFDITKLMWTVG